jgi:hypothetical protein
MPGAGGGAAAQPVSNWSGIRDAARDLGYQFGQDVTSDQAALAHLIQNARNLEHLQALQQQQAPLLQQAQLYQQYGPQFQQWLQQQQQWQEYQRQQAAQWWRAPEWKQEWMNLLRQDAQGNITAVPGAPPGIVDKYNNFVNHQRDVMYRLATDPMGLLGPGIQQVVQQQAAAMIQQQLGQYRGQQYAQGFIDQHSDWLYAKDAQGRFQVDPAGNKLYSPLGQRFVHYMQEADSIGIPNGKDKAEYARKLVAAEIQMAQSQQAAQASSNQAAGEAQKQQFVQQGAGYPPSAGGSQVPPTNPNAPAAMPNGAASKYDLQRLMLENLKRNGFAADAVLDLGR